MATGWSHFVGGFAGTAGDGYGSGVALWGSRLPAWGPEVACG